MKKAKLTPNIKFPKMPKVISVTFDYKTDCMMCSKNYWVGSSKASAKADYCSRNCELMDNREWA